MKFGLKSAHWKIIEDLVLRPIHGLSGSVFVFGSRARGDFKEFSDLDLLIRGDISPILVSKIKDDLEESNLPIKVDLVLEKSVAESYKENILKDCVSATLST